MTGISINNLAKWFEDTPALRDIDLEIEKGEFMVMLGPSGCGKTTSLRCIAGIEKPSGGQIILGDREVYSEFSNTNVPAKDRDVGFVFQNFALYPHMTVYENVAFGLKIRHTAKKDIASRVGEALQMVELETLADRKPKQLSGGQQQRVAVARVIARNPSYLLFDEPLSNLDPKLRVHMRTHIRRVHRELEATSLYVTHDQHEAMILADRIAVMDKGLIVQVGSPDEIYHYPASVEVASFTGNPKTNIIEGEISRFGEEIILIPAADPFCFIPLSKEFNPYVGQEIFLHVRPEDIELVTEPGEEEGKLRLLITMSQGADSLIYLRFSEGREHIIVRGEPLDIIRFKSGQKVGLRFRRGNIYRKEDHLLSGGFGGLEKRISSNQRNLI